LTIFQPRGPAGLAEGAGLTSYQLVKQPKPGECLNLKFISSTYFCYCRLIL